YRHKPTDIQPTLKHLENILKHQNNFKNLTTTLSHNYHQYTFNPHQQKLPKLPLTPSQIPHPIPPQANQTTFTK
ncbi:hypothetical protein, partial [Bacillus altitudinis]|uniref:hypothetical protein n=1 Tax=Bacillus altitudinis TaxID=293387 RepID=UPI001C92F7DF